MTERRWICFRRDGACRFYFQGIGCGYGKHALWTERLDKSLLLNATQVKESLRLLHEQGYGVTVRRAPMFLLR